MSEQIRWQQRGGVYLWRYIDNRRNYAGWHLTADVAGAESLADLLSMFRQAKWSCLHRVTISRPTPEILAVPGNRGGSARWSAPCESLVLRYPKGKVAPESWVFTRGERECELTLGAQMLDEFYEGVKAIQRGEGDYAIGHLAGSDDDCLWFWWHPH